jgi:hypothetical protein
VCFYREVQQVAHRDFSGSVDTRYTNGVCAGNNSPGSLRKLVAEHGQARVDAHQDGVKGKAILRSVIRFHVHHSKSSEIEFRFSWELIDHASIFFSSRASQFFVFLNLLLVALVQLVSPSVESIRFFVHGTDQGSGEMKDESSSVFLLLPDRIDVTGNCVFPIILEPI